MEKPDIKEPLKCVIHLTKAKLMHRKESHPGEDATFRLQKRKKK
jgi:hypothetical protein